MQRIGKTIYSALLLIGILSVINSCESHESTSERWFKAITTNCSYQPHSLLLEYQSSYRIDTLTQNGDTLWSALEPDSAGIVSVLDSAGLLLHAFAVNERSRITLHHDNRGFAITSNDSLNIRLALYYKAEMKYKNEFISFRDSSLKKKISLDSIPSIWVKKHFKTDSLWREEALHFVRQHSKSEASSIPIQSYLLRTDNTVIRDSARQLLNKELTLFRFIQFIQ